MKTSNLKKTLLVTSALLLPVGASAQNPQDTFKWPAVLDGTFVKVGVSSSWTQWDTHMAHSFLKAQSHKVRPLIALGFESHMGNNWVSGIELSTALSIQSEKDRVGSARGGLSFKKLHVYRAGVHVGYLFNPSSAFFVGMGLEGFKVKSTLESPNVNVHKTKTLYVASPVIGFRTMLDAHWALEGSYTYTASGKLNVHDHGGIMEYAKPTSNTVALALRYTI